MRLAALALCALAALAAPTAARAQAETDLSGEEIDTLLGRLVDRTDMSVRAAALSALLEAQAGAVPVLTDRLFRPNGIQAALIERLVEDYVRRLPEELPPESPVPRRTALAPLLHLLILAPHEAYEETWAAVLQTVALLAALEVVDTNEALMEAIRFVGEYEGAFARAVGILVRSKGDRSIPALVLSRRVQIGEVREFVGIQLRRMGKERPALMAQVDDDQLLADILRAVAEVHDREGVNVMLSFINSDRPFVRKAARESLLMYERNALWPLRGAYEDLVGERADTSWDWRETAERLFAAQDALRLEPLDALLTRGLNAAREERFAEMDEAFGAILGREPEYPRRAEMVPGLLAYGERLLERGEVLEARRLLRLAEYLVPDQDTRAARIRAHLAYLEGLRRRDLGFPDSQPFRQAARLDPGYEKLIASRGDLAELVAGPEEDDEGNPIAAPAAAPVAERSGRTTRLAVAAGILLVALAALALLVATGRAPGRLFGPVPPAEPAAVVQPVPLEEAPAPAAPAPIVEPELPAAPAAVAAATPEPATGSDVGDRPSALGDRPPEIGDRTSAIGDRPSEIGDRTSAIGDRPSEIGDRPSASAAASDPAPAPDDAYRRIEAALAKIRKDLPAGGGDGAEVERERERGHDHGHDHDHDDGSSGGRRKG